MTTPFSFMFYNTENFYDTSDDPGVMDSEFTPGGRLRWDEKRFNDKVTSDRGTRQPGCTRGDGDR